jgi:hypothetical protein
VSEAARAEIDASAIAIAAEMAMGKVSTGFMAFPQMS